MAKDRNFLEGLIIRKPALFHKLCTSFLVINSLMLIVFVILGVTMPFYPLAPSYAFLPLAMCVLFVIFAVSAGVFGRVLERTEWEPYDMKNGSPWGCKLLEKTETALRVASLDNQLIDVAESFRLRGSHGSSDDFYCVRIQRLEQDDRYVVSGKVSSKIG